MKINSSYRLASVSSLFLLLASCGGSSGGGAPAPAPAPAPAAVPIATINGHVIASFTAADGSTDQGRMATAFTYAERAGDTPSAPVLSVSSNILNVTSSFSNTGGST